MNTITSSYGYLYQFVIMPNFVYLHDYQEYKSAFGKGFRRLCGMNGVKVHQMDLEDDHINIIIELPRWVHYKKFIKTLKSSCYKLIIREICPDSSCLKLKDFWSKLHAARWYSAENPDCNKAYIAEILEMHRACRNAEEGNFQSNAS